MNTDQNDRRYCVPPTYVTEIVDLSKVGPQPVVFKKNGKKLPVKNRRTARAFGKANYPKVILYRQNKRAITKAIISAIRDTAFRLYLESNERAIRDQGLGEFPHPASQDARDIKSLLSLTR